MRLYPGLSNPKAFALFSVICLLRGREEALRLLQQPTRRAQGVAVGQRAERAQRDRGQDGRGHDGHTNQEAGSLDTQPTTVPRASCTSPRLGKRWRRGRLSGLHSYTLNPWLQRQ